MREIELAHVVIKLRGSDDRSYYLLHRHEKWGDWTLVGGHVEPGEEGLWARTAERETEEEMAPLQHSRDFLLVPLLSRPVTWGPKPSRSAGGALTVYRAQFFRMVFRRDPVGLLGPLGERGFTLLSEEQLANDNVGDLVRQLEQHLEGGLSELPAAWTVPVSPDLISSGLPDTLVAADRNKAN